MAFDVIVFNQEELLRALDAGVRSIALCDNCFSLPDTDGIQYTIIGNVTIDGDNLSIPHADKPSEETPDSGFCVSSYGTSFSSANSGSYNYKYEYEYGGSFTASYASSYASSYAASYASAYSSSFSSSFASSYYSFISGFTFEFGSGYFGSYAFGGSYAFTGSYEYTGSYGGSYSTSYAGSYTLLPDIIEYGSSGIIFVNGYGINLI